LRNYSWEEVKPQVDEVVFPDLGVKLTQLSPGRAGYLGLDRAGPFKPEHYRY